MGELAKLLASMPFIGEFIRRLHDYLFCTAPQFIPLVTTKTTGETKISDLEADWIAVKDLSVPMDYLEFRGQSPKGGEVAFRWYRGETKRVAIHGPLYVMQTSIAITFTLIFGRGIPDNTCCFEIRDANENTAWSSSESTLTGAGTLDTILAQSMARTGVILWNKSTTAGEIIHMGDTTAGARRGIPLSPDVGQGPGKVTLCGSSAQAAIKVEAAAGTPKIGILAKTRS